MGKIKRRRNFRFLQSINVCLQILLRMILLIESHIRRRRRRIGIALPSTCQRNYMGMLFVYDSTSFIAIAMATRLFWFNGRAQNTLAPDECSGTSTMLGAHRELLSVLSALSTSWRCRTHKTTSTITPAQCTCFDSRKIFICASNEAERITIINGQCTPCDLEEHGQLESFRRANESLVKMWWWWKSERC